MVELREDKLRWGERSEKTSALVKEANEKTLKLFTGEQQAKWKELTGGPFIVKFDLPSGPNPQPKKKKGKN